MKPTETTAWQTLAKRAGQAAPIKDLLPDTDRAGRLIHDLNGCHFDFTRQCVDTTTLNTLFELSNECGVLGLRDAMFTGQAINLSENRRVLHMALRDGAPDVEPGLQAEVEAVRQRMLDIGQAIHSGKWRGHAGHRITDVVHIGIGGSHFGIELIERALARYRQPYLNTHFVANIDPEALQAVLARVNPDRTLFIVASKSFGTLETLHNARSARSWFLERTTDKAGLAQHFIAITNNVSAAAEFGLPAQNLLPMWDWVGGRFSLWSAIGLTLVLSLGADNFNALLEGARQADDHFRSTDPETNIPLLSALFTVWNSNFLGAQSHVTLCYDERLALLPDFLQQLEMESNGKSVDRQGEPVTHHTAPVLWGGTGTQGQHAYHQLLHQGTRAFSADLLMVATPELPLADHHTWLLANGLAQSEAFAQGYHTAEAHRAVAGDRAHSVIVLQTLSPGTLGTLLALFEHRTFCLGALWNVNAFDQWGVELGKKLAPPIFDALQDSTNVAVEDPSTLNLIDHIKRATNNAS